MYKKFLLIMSLSSVMAVAQAKKESFNYPPHKLTDNGWVNSNIGEIFVASEGSLTFGKLPVEGGKVSLPFKSDKGSNNVNLSFTTPVTTTAYVSFLMKVTNISKVEEYKATNGTDNVIQPAYFINFSPDQGSKLSVSRFGVAKKGDKFVIGIVNATGGAQIAKNVYGETPKEYNVGETYFVVMKYDMTGDKGITSIWVNPSSTTEPIPNHTTDAGGGKTTKKQPQIASLSLRQTKNKMASVDIDEIRLGSSWADVFPTILSTSEVNIDATKLISNTSVKDNFKVLKNSKVEIYNASGHIVKSVNAIANQEINISDLNVGAYIVKITHNNKTSVVKIIKQ